jgi:hypothetical protein
VGDPCGTRSRSTSSTTTANDLIRGSGTNWSRLSSEHRTASAPSSGARGSAGCSTSIAALRRSADARVRAVETGAAHPRRPKTSSTRRPNLLPWIPPSRPENAIEPPIRHDPAVAPHGKEDAAGYAGSAINEYLPGAGADAEYPSCDDWHRSSVRQPDSANANERRANEDECATRLDRCELGKENRFRIAVPSRDSAFARATAKQSIAAFEPLTRRVRAPTVLAVLRFRSPKVAEVDVKKFVASDATGSCGSRRPRFASPIQRDGVMGCRVRPFDPGTRRSSLVPVVVRRLKRSALLTDLSKSFQGLAADCLSGPLSSDDRLMKTKLVGCKRCLFTPDPVVLDRSQATG